MHQLRLLLWGIKRVKGISKRLPRFPMTITILKLLKTALNQTTLCNYDKHMLWAAFTLAFFGFLRSAEFCSPQAQCFNCHSTLLKSDLSLHQTSMSIHIKVSKADPFRNGTNIVVHATNTSVCPVRAMTHYLQHRRRGGPLFIFANGRYLTRNSLTDILRYLLSSVSLDTDRFSSHSFRIGAATTAAAAGVPDWLIKVMGRWASDAFQVYIRTGDDSLRSVAEKMATTRVPAGMVHWSMG